MEQTPRISDCVISALCKHLNCCCSFDKLSPTLCNPMVWSTPGLPVLHHLPDFAQIYVHWVSDAVQPSLPLSSPSPLALSLSQHQGGITLRKLESSAWAPQGSFNSLSSAITLQSLVSMSKSGVLPASFMNWISIVKTTWNCPLHLQLCTGNFILIYKAVLINIHWPTA